MTSPLHLTHLPLGFGMLQRWIGISRRDVFRRMAKNRGIGLFTDSEGRRLDLRVIRGQLVVKSFVLDPKFGVEITWNGGGHMVRLPHYRLPVTFQAGMAKMPLSALMSVPFLPVSKLPVSSLKSIPSGGTLIEFDWPGIIVLGRPGTQPTTGNRAGRTFAPVYQPGVSASR